MEDFRTEMTEETDGWISCMDMEPNLLESDIRYEYPSPFLKKKVKL